MSASSPQPSGAAVDGQFLSFRLGAEEYGVEILKVQEIRGYDHVTSIAHAADVIKGVINLRGSIVPIVDLRIKFAAGNASYDAFTVVIILNVANRVVGMVVDSVSDVITLSAGQVRPAPQLGSSTDTTYILGLASLEERMIILVDIERLMTRPEMGLIEEHLAAA